MGLLDMLPDKMVIASCMFTHGPPRRCEPAPVAGALGPSDANRLFPAQLSCGREPRKVVFPQAKHL